MRKKARATDRLNYRHTASVLPHHDYSHGYSVVSTNFLSMPICIGPWASIHLWFCYLSCLVFGDQWLVRKIGDFLWKSRVDLSMQHQYSYTKQRVFLFFADFRPQLCGRFVAIKGGSSFKFLPHLPILSFKAKRVQHSLNSPEVSSSLIISTGTQFCRVLRLQTVNDDISKSPCTFPREWRVNPPCILKTGQVLMS